TGAIAATLLFNLLVQISQFSGITPKVEPISDVAVGTLAKDLKKDRHGKIVLAEIDLGGDEHVIFHGKKVPPPPPDIPEGDGDNLDFMDRLLDVYRRNKDIDFDEDLFEQLSGGLKKGDRVLVSEYTVRGVQHFRIRAAGQAAKDVYDYEIL